MKSVKMLYRSANRSPRVHRPDVANALNWSARSNVLLEKLPVAQMAENFLHQSFIYLHFRQNSRR